MASKNGSKVAERPEVGLVRTQLQQPERAAELSVAEAEEIRERKRLIEAQQKTAEDHQKVLALLRSEYIRYLEKLLDGRGLERTRSDYDVDSTRGIIWKTGILTEPDPMSEIAETAPVDVIVKGDKG